MKKCLCISILLLFGCNIFKRKRDSNDDIKPTVDPNAHVVMVIDSGIDPHHDSYKDKVLGAFTLVCGLGEQSDESIEPLTLDEAKKNLIEEFKKSESIRVGSLCT